MPRRLPPAPENGWQRLRQLRGREGCGYTTYAELAALNHDLIHHAAQAPSCTETGWNAWTTPAGARAAATLPIRSLTRWDIPMKPARFSPPARRKDIPCIPASAAKTGIPMRSFPALRHRQDVCRTATPPAAPIASETAASIRARFPASRLPVACCSGTRRHMISRSVLSAARLNGARLT